MIGPRTAWTHVRHLAIRRARHVLHPIVGPALQTLQSLCDQMVRVRQQQDDLRGALGAIDSRQTELTEQVQATQAIGWDHAALVRRLATLEERVETLTAELERRDAAESMRPAASAAPLSRAG
jgi:hypothetical protein